MNDAEPGRRLRLLPADRYLGWTPYVWLVYLTGFLAEPIALTVAGRGGIGLWAGTVAGLGIFLFTYFRGYWESGRRLLVIIAAQAALGAVYAPFNHGSFVFFIYAGAFAGQLGRRRVAVRALALLTLVVTLVTWLVDVPTLLWAFGAVLIWVIGGVILHFTQVRQADGELRLAQEEIRHLAAVAERERIARDLHDVLGHTLSLIVLKSELATKLLDRDARRASREIRDVEHVARDALREVREAIGGYRASLDDEIARARSLLTAAGVRADVEETAARNAWGDRREAVLALALREAVTNIVRHAEASRCRVRIGEAGETCLLEIEDDGRGLDALEGGGLRGMRERVRALGGTVEIGPALARRGTRVRVTLPAVGADRSPPVVADGTRDADPARTT